MIYMMWEGGTKSLRASIHHRSSSDVVDSDKAHLKDVYKSAFLHVYHSADTFLALPQAVPRVWNLNSAVSRVEPMVSFLVWPLICLYQYQYQSPRGGQLLILISPSSSHHLPAAQPAQRGSIWSENMHEYCVQLAFEQHEYYIFSYPLDCMNIKCSFKPWQRWNTPSVVIAVSKTFDHRGGRCNWGEWGCEETSDWRMSYYGLNTSK